MKTLFDDIFFNLATIIINGNPYKSWNSEKKMGHSCPLFLYFCLFYCTIGRLNLASAWIQSTDLMGWKQPLYQLSHNHCPTKVGTWNSKESRIKKDKLILEAATRNSLISGWFQSLGEGGRLCTEIAFMLLSQPLWVWIWRGRKKLNPNRQNGKTFH